ncbi:hypothetical protein PR202_gb12713 [Eleusine coracana subsp. coracana]|uniref:Pectinesterase inhibitor domain-containing protein n=1 Tax=Eleusine coracana subsp. coracana TaxID=191504 RepID=A0AAV5EQK9_ELECO|nr:hypothetical protein PR202_gb12713 [Eleusine coracana subsp. coracana]
MRQRKTMREHHQQQQVIASPRRHGPSSRPRPSPGLLPPHQHRAGGAHRDRHGAGGVRQDPVPQDLRGEADPDRGQPEGEPAAPGGAVREPGRAEAGSGMAAFVNGKFTGATKDDAVFKCYDSCSDEVEEAVAHLNGLVREPTDGKFLELKSWLSSTLGGTSACEDACRDAPATGDKDAVLKYSVDVEKMLRITLDLIAEASGSMSDGIALPPTGAEAPFAGYGSAAEAPGPEAMSVFPEGDGAASSSSEGAEAPSLGSAEGPTPINAFKEAPKVEAPGPSVASEEATEGPAPAVAASGDESGHGAEEPAADDGASDADATA